MAEIVNLRQARKAKKRTDGEKAAAANRASFGLSKGEKQRQKLEADRQARELEGARRERSDD